MPEENKEGQTNQNPNDQPNNQNNKNTNSEPNKDQQQPKAPLDARSQLYDKLYSQILGTDDGEPANDDPESTSSATPATTPTVDQSAVIQTVNELKSEIAQLRQAGQHQQADKVEEKAKNFLEHVQTGDFEGAEAALIGKVSQTVSPQVLQQATENAVLYVRAENEVRRHADKLRDNHPELEPYERYVGLLTDQLFGAARNSGQIKTVEDYVAAYKQAMNTAADRVRKDLLRERGAGKDEANKRQEQVGKSVGLRPNSAQDHSQNNNAEEDKVPFEPQPVSDYIEQRRKRQLAGQGYAVNQGQ